MISFSCMLREALKKQGLVLCDEKKLDEGYGSEAQLSYGERHDALLAIANSMREQLVKDGVVLQVKLEEREGTARCLKPTDTWCTLDRGHDGPCRPHEPTCAVIVDNYTNEACGRKLPCNKHR